MKIKEFDSIASRFRGYWPVVVDIETGGLDPLEHPILELAAVTLDWQDGTLVPAEHLHFHVEPFAGAQCDEKALAFTGIIPDHPFRFAVSEDKALRELFTWLRTKKKAVDCKRAVLVGHNAWFDLSFLNEAVKRCAIKRNPFHPFTSFDTATLAGLAVGETVLATACLQSGIEFDAKQAHSALYDAQKTAELFCAINNKWAELVAK